MRKPSTSEPRGQKPIRWSGQFRIRQSCQGTTQQQTNRSLYPRATDHVALSDNAIAGDIFQRRAAAQRHGDLELIPQHPQRIPHPCPAVHGEGEQYGPSNLTEDKHEYA